MQNTTSNTNPGMDSLDWAKRFVPLPPTEFPPEATAQSRDNAAVERSVDNVLDRLDAQANLPCLQAIAGVDPFFSAEETLPATGEQLEKIVTDNACSLSSFEPTTDGPLSPIVNSDNPSQTNNDIAASPSVEVIGQQTPQSPITTLKNQPAETSLHEEKPQVKLMNNATPDNSSSEKSTVGIHEYDLAMKVLPNIDAVGSQKSQGPENDVANESASDDIASYWSQDNVSCFIPGVTPIEAYPVCQEYVDQISVSCDERLASTTDDQLEQASQPEQTGQPEQASQSECCQPEQTQSDEQAENPTNSGFNVGEFTPLEELTPTAEATNAVVECSHEPTQIDPFENDEFDSVQHVTPVKLGNQSLPSTSTTLAAAAYPSNVETSQTNEPVDSHTNDSASVEVATESVEPQVEPAPEVPQVAATPLDVTQSIPQLPNNIASPQTGSHQLFESVEQSLDDLQSINQLEPDNTFAPATNALYDSPTQPQQATNSPVEAPAEVESFEVDEMFSTAMPSAPVEQSVPTEVSNPVASTAQAPLADDSAAVENSIPAVTSASLAAAALASLSLATQPDTQEFHPVDLTAQLPAVPSGSIHVPPAAPAETSFDTTIMPREVDVDTPVAAEPPAAFSAPSPEPAPTQETRTQETRTQETRTQETRTEETRTEEALSKEAPTEEAPTEEALTEEALTEEALAEEALAEEAPTEETLTEETLTEETLTEEALTEEALTEEAPTEEAPTEEALTEEALTEEALTEEAPTEEAPTAPATEPSCQVIEVDGNDGYDFLDLKAFDVADAILTPGIIFLDNGKNKFQIQYRNLDLAVFADDFQVELASV